jgi:general secretion pathway protein L
MSLLRIYCPLRDPPQQCQWALVNDGRAPVTGEGRLAELPRGAERVQLVIPAAQVLITRASLPPAARRRAGSVLAFAVEEETAGEPETNQVSWLGSVTDLAGDSDVLAVVDKQGLARWRDALGAAGIRAYEVHCETLLLPWTAVEWSLAWDGHEGFVRTGEFEGGATDCGDRDTPPLSLRLMLEAAHARKSSPGSIALYSTTPDAAPDIAEWEDSLGIAFRMAGPWDWRAAASDAGIALAQERQRWGGSLAGVATRLRPVAWIAVGALAIHTVSLVVDWTQLASQQRALRQKMEARFRGVFPDAVAVADPALQMRRKLAEARHAAGLPDSGDFLPLVEQVAPGIKAELPAGSVRVASYEGGRITLELAVTDEAAVHRLTTRLRQAGLSVDTAATAARPGGGTVVITVRSS